jgi:prepilin peptidase CpaA
LFTTSEAVTLGAAVAASAAAVATDIRWRRIPNAVTVTTALAGVGLAASGLSGISVGASLAGVLVGLLLMLPGHAFGATGAGDVKLFAAAGTLLGPDRILAAFLYTAIAGGILALAVASRKGRLRRTLGTTGRLLAKPASARGEIEAPHAGNKFPYGPAIAAGTILAALGL